MIWVVLLLQILVFLACLVCFILVLVKMFQNGQTGLGIACIVLAFCGVGFLITFIFGWMKAKEWGITNIMWGWTGLIVFGIILQFASMAVAPTVSSTTFQMPR